MTTIVYYDHDGGDLCYEQFDTTEEALAWWHGNDCKGYIIEGSEHTIHDHT